MYYRIQWVEYSKPKKFTQVTNPPDIGVMDVSRKSLDTYAKKRITSSDD